MTLIVDTTARCRNTPRLLFALEEAQLAYGVTVREDGWFERTHGRPGPMLEDGPLRLLEVNAILRHLARAHAPRLWPADRAAESDAWMDFALSTFRPALLGVVQAAKSPAPADLQQAMASPAGAKLIEALRLVDAALAGDWLAGDFGLADIALSSIAILPLGPMRERLPRLASWVGRITERPAYRAASSRMAANQEANHAVASR